MRSALAVHMPVQLGLLGSAIAADEPARSVLSVLGLGIGAAVLTVSAWRRRPQPPLAWWLVAARAWSIVVESISVTVAYGPEPGVTITAPGPTLIATLHYPLIAVGLFVLSRSSGRRGPVDVLDATITALATFLLLWGFVFTEVLTISTRTVEIGVVLPLGALLAFAMAVKVVLGGGLRDPATALLIVSVAVLLGLTLINFVLGIESGALCQRSPKIDPLWVSES